MSDSNRREIPQSIGALAVQSDSLSGRIDTTASKRLASEVFTKMLTDEVGQVARADKLIIQLGNQWMEKNVGNKLKRGVYTSQILRLVAKFLIAVRKLKPLSELSVASMWDYLKPEHFQTLVQATIITAMPYMDDEENLASPSYAIKLGYDLKRLINGKIGLSIIGEDQNSRKHAEDLLKLMEVCWGTRITKTAKIILEEMRFNADKQLPVPEDIQRLNVSLKKTISELDYSETDNINFRHVAEVIEAKLVLYNRRRTGELQAIRLVLLNIFLLSSTIII